MRLRAIWIVCVLATTVFSGCAAARQLRDQLDHPLNPAPIHDKEFIKQLTATLDRQGKKLREAYLKNPTNNPNEPALIAYVETGITIAKLNCSDYFDRLVRANAGKGFVRGSLLTGGGLATTLLGLLEAGLTATTAVGAGTAFITNMFDNYDQNLLVAADPSKTYQLVLRAEAAAANILKVSGKPNNIMEAETGLRSYAELCTFAGIRGLISQSLDSNEPTVSGSAGSMFVAPGRVPAATTTPAPAAPSAPPPPAPVTAPAPPAQR